MSTLRFLNVRSEGPKFFDRMGHSRVQDGCPCCHTEAVKGTKKPSISSLSSYLVNTVIVQAKRHRKSKGSAQYHSRIQKKWDKRVSKEGADSKLAVQSVVLPMRVGGKLKAAIDKVVAQTSDGPRAIAEHASTVWEWIDNERGITPTS